METLKIHQVVEKDGEIRVTGLPLRRGQQVELTLRLESEAPAEKPLPTVRDLLASGLVGLWADRSEVEDSVEFARRLRTESLRQPS